MAHVFSLEATGNFLFKRRGWLAVLDLALRTLKRHAYWFEESERSLLPWSAT
ncbi:hypothetical protein [Pontibacter sp. SGAir0037]|uniref:hypothetical protein n=1 Tax=Pontibacter sp. SGAir0037 TaxID=2571030 RepID=UPI00143D2838|nr:hypothetical protein [Pontibacter sp. SGAir0037]